jgi:hypothetical protein
MPDLLRTQKKQQKHEPTEPIGLSMRQWEAADIMNDEFELRPD